MIFSFVNIKVIFMLLLSLVKSILSINQNKQRKLHGNLSF